MEDSGGGSLPRTPRSPARPLPPAMEVVYVGGCVFPRKPGPPVLAPGSALRSSDRKAASESSGAQDYRVTAEAKGVC